MILHNQFVDVPLQFIDNQEPTLFPAIQYWPTWFETSEPRDDNIRREPHIADI